MYRSLTLLLTLTMLPAALAAQKFMIVNPSVTTPPGGALIDIILERDSTGGKSNLGPSLSIADLTRTSSGEVKRISGPTWLGGNDEKGYWRMTWQISGLRPGTSETHLLQLGFGQIIEVLPLTFHGPEDIQATVTGPGVPLRLRLSHDSQIKISNTGVLTHVIPAQSTLVEEQTGEPLPLDKIDLVDKKGQAATSAGLTLNEAVQPLYIRVSQDFSAPGKFSGNISLGSREKSDLGTFVLTVYSTSTKRKLLGVLFLCLGLLTYFVIAIWVKVRSRWDLALLPAVRLREEASDLLRATEGIQQKTNYKFEVLLANPGNPGSLRNVLDKLSLQKLKLSGYLPWRFAVPFASQDMSMQYQSFLLTTGNQITSFDMIVRWGLASVLAMWQDVENYNLQVNGNTALEALDGMGLFVGPPALLITQIQGTINVLATAISNAKAAGGGAQPTSVYGVPASRQLTIQIEELSAFVWIAWAALTVVIGCCVLIWFNDGFGTAQDLAKCFLWGAGMPAVGQGFGALSAGSVTSAFSVLVPH